MNILNFYKIGKCLTEDQAYIGRSMPHLGLMGSVFANPFKITEYQSREEVINKYKYWLYSRIKIGKITKKDFLALEGKDLVCFCKQDNKEVACHGDVVKAAYNWIMKQED